MPVHNQHSWQPWQMVGQWDDGRDGWERQCPDCGLVEYREVAGEIAPSRNDAAVTGTVLRPAHDRRNGQSGNA